MGRVIAIGLACLISTASTASFAADMAKIQSMSLMFVENYCQLKVTYSFPKDIPADHPKLAQMTDMTEDIVNDIVTELKSMGFSQPTKLAAVGNQLAPEYLKNPALVSAAKNWQLEAAAKVCTDAIVKSAAYKSAVTNYSERPNASTTSYKYGANQTSAYDRTCMINGDKFTKDGLISQLAEIDPGAKILNGQQVITATGVQAGFALARTRPFRSNESCRNYIVTEAVAEEMALIVEMYPGQKFTGKVIGQDAVAQAVSRSEAAEKSSAERRRIEEQNYQDALNKKREWRQSGSSLSPLK